TVPVAIGEMPMPLLPVDEVLAAANARLGEVSAAIKAMYPSLDVSTAAMYGNLGDLVEELTEQSAPLLTVVGNDEDDGADLWIGSEGADVLRKGARPALAVPQTSVFKKPQHVCIACDAQSIREGMSLASLLALQEQLGFSITVMHVAGEDGEAIVY